jgi:hypothetical protein
MNQLSIANSSNYVNTWFQCQPGVKEESLTDWLLFDLSCNNPDIVYKAFTRNEESRVTGADWEWWFLFHDCTVKLRVQAKKIKEAKSNFAALNYKDGAQISMLLADASASNAIPFYTFYSENSSGIVCPHNKSGENFLEGVFLQYAPFTKACLIGGDRRQTLGVQLVRKSYPLSCFICCLSLFGRPWVGLSGPAVIAEGIDNDDLNAGFEESISEFDLQRQDGFFKGEVGYYDALPAYVEEVLRNDKEPSPTFLELNKLGSLSGLAVFDRRPKFLLRT